MSAPDDPEALFAQGLEFLSSNAHAAAVSAFKACLARCPGHAAARIQLALTLHGTGQLDEALAIVREGRRLAPADNPLALVEACILEDRRDIDGAEAVLDEILAREPGHHDAWLNKATLYLNGGRHPEALPLLEALLQAYPASSMGRNNLIQAHFKCGNYETALALCEDWLQVDPSRLNPAFDRCIALACLGRFAEADASIHHLARHHAAEFESRIRRQMGPDVDVDPDGVTAEEIFLVNYFERLNACDWRHLARYNETFSRVLPQMPPEHPVFNQHALAFLALSIPLDSPTRAWLARSISSHVYWRVRQAPPPSRPPDGHGQGKLRIGYVSADFRLHPVSFLMGRLFELHDRDRFEIHAYSLRAPDDSPWAARLRGDADHFTDVSALGVRAISQLIADDGIDILVDLSGYTRGGKPEVLALRPAPIQLSWLGFVGTSGSDWLDYRITDRIASQAADLRTSSEKLVFLPDCHFITNNKLLIAPTAPSRTEQGLPEHGFVFCCFNNGYKIEPDIFSLWLRILKQVPDSVLWLYACRPDQPDNLRAFARAHGVDPKRLVFARFQPHAEHLARYQRADLFLDTHHYNAGATAADALWAGLPVLTLPGESPMSRVAASMLVSLNLHGLIARSRDEYAALAVHLATHPRDMGMLKGLLSLNRRRQPLFQTERFVRHLEDAYELMWQRHRRGLPPEHLVVPPRRLTEQDYRATLPA